MKKVNNDKRLKERIRIQEEVRVYYKDMKTFITEYADNISMGGMFIKTARPFPTGTRFKLELTIEDKKNTIAGIGEVVWTKEFSSGQDSRPSGMGIRFVELHGDSRKFIKEFIERCCAH